MVAAEHIADWECTRATLPTEPPQPKITKRIMSRRKPWSQLDGRGRQKHLGKVKQRVKDLAAKLGTEVDGQFTIEDVNAGGMSDKAYMLMRRAQPNTMPFQRVQHEMHS